MQFIGAHQILGALCDLAVVLGGQQLRGHRGVEDVQQHLFQGRGGGNVGFVPDKVAHQRFGYACVHAVHAHVVAVVGGPAQGQLGKVAGAHHQAAGAVGSVHQLQGAHAGLAVLVGHVQHALVLADVPEVAVHRGGNVDLGKADVQLVTEDLRIAAGALGGAKAGHGHGQHIGGGAAQLFHGAHGHQQGKAAVQTAGNADDGCFGAGVLKTLGQAVGLHLQNQLTALGTQLLVVGDKGGGVYPAGQHGVGQGQVELHGLVALGAGLKAGVARPLRFHPLAVQLCLGKTARKGLHFSQQGAVLGDQVVACEHHVLGAPAVARRGVQVAAEQAGRLVLHQCPAVLGLAHRFIAGRKVGDDGSACQCVEGGGRQGAPQVLAELHAQHKAGHLTAAEEQGGAEGDILPADIHPLHLGGAGGELPLFIELAVVGQVRFGNQTQQLPAAEHGSAVVQLAPHHQGQAHKGHGVQLPAGIQQLLQAGQGSLLQGALQKQVAAGIAGQAELREHGQLYAAGGGGTQLREDLPGVVGAVRHPKRGREGCCFQKTIFHRRISHPVSLVCPRRTTVLPW